MTYNSGNQRLRGYFNASEVGSNVASQPLNNITRLYNYIGKSCAGGYPNLDGIVDELKIFNKELSQKEIEFEMNN